MLRTHSRQELLDILEEQDPDLRTQVRRIEWVFENKLDHLTWEDGSPINGRPLTKEEILTIIDPPFIENEEWTEYGFSEDEQRKAHIASDPVLWAKHFLGVKPRAYQILILRSEDRRVVLRLGRRAGKTFCLAILSLHYAYTTEKGRVLVMAPTKAQVGLIYEEAINLAEDTLVDESIVRAVASPQYEINLSNGSTIRLFTTGMRSNTKSDGTRGQEAHIIILDEMDYMGSEDLDALFAMLQKTDENQPDKRMIGASTPTGLKNRFWEWCTGDLFREFWFPSYVNPHFTKETEAEFRDLYGENGFRREVEADWGEAGEGVYPRKYVDKSRLKDWDYLIGDLKKNKKYLIGVDWDKYRAGPNICVLEIVKAAEDPFETHDIGKVRVAYREELPQTEYALTEAVDRIVQLNKMIDPEFIYVDKGNGDTQIELLHKEGLKHPESGLKKKVKGVHFASTMEVIDPATKQKDKKRVKLLLVENLRNMFEQEQLLIPNSDDELYLQLISYVVKRMTASGDPVFEALGQPDHAHDALLLACMAYMENYNDLLKATHVTSARSVSPFAFDSAGIQSDERAKLKTAQQGPKREGAQPYRKMRRTGVRSRGTISRRNI